MAKTLKSTLSGVWLMQTVKMSVPVPWELTYTVTRLKTKKDATNECEVTVTNDD